MFIVPTHDHHVSLQQKHIKVRLQGMLLILVFCCLYRRILAYHFGFNKQMNFHITYLLFLSRLPSMNCIIHLSHPWSMIQLLSISLYMSCQTTNHIKWGSNTYILCTLRNCLRVYRNNYRLRLMYKTWQFQQYQRQLQLQRQCMCYSIFWLRVPSQRHYHNQKLVLLSNQ